MRPLASVAGTRWTRCTPDSNFSFANTPLPLIPAVTSFDPPRSDELSLNNSVVDCSYLKEPMAWKVFQQAGVPWLRTAWAWVTINGLPFGFYQVIETPNDDWVARHWEDSSGNLYDGKYVWYGGWSYTLLDFGIGVDDQFQLEEGEDNGNADIAAVSAA